MFFIEKIIMAESNCLGQDKPGLNSPFSFGEAVVVTDTMEPESSRLAQGTAGDDGGIFDRDVFLVVESISNPTFNLLWRELATVHIPVKWVLIVVAAGAERAQFIQ